MSVCPSARPHGTTRLPLHCLQPIFTRRTSGHFPGTFRAVCFLFHPPCNNTCITSHDTPNSSAFLSFPRQRDMKWQPDITHFMCKLSSLDAAERCVLLLFRIRKAPAADLGPESEWLERCFHFSTAPPG